MTIKDIHATCPEGSLLQRDFEGVLWYSFKAEFVIRVTPETEVPSIPLTRLEITTLAEMTDLCAGDLCRYDMINRKEDGDDYVWTTGPAELRAPKRYIDLFEDTAYIYYDMDGGLIYIFKGRSIEGIVREAVNNA